MTAVYRSAVASLAMIAASFGASGVGRAQTAAPMSQDDLQRSAAGSALAGAMTTLATQPRNISALIAAGEAALELDDPRSALGFFGRADDLSPGNGRVKAGMGRAMLHLEQIGDGLRLMEQAGNLGYTDEGLYADRGLARDLMGNQAGAQQDYQAALRLEPKDEMALRRYAISLGISGQVDQAQKMLQPLLYKSDRAAWRDNAFILAMNGRTGEALSITDRVMPRALADAIKPYMERMAMLTPEQRAAAVHMGQFPPGLVNVRVATTAVPARTSAPVAPSVRTPVQMAEVAPPQPAAPSSRTSRRKRSRHAETPPATLAMADTAATGRNATVPASSAGASSAPGAASFPAPVASSGRSFALVQPLPQSRTEAQTRTATRTETEPEPRIEPVPEPREAAPAQTVTVRTAAAAAVAPPTGGRSSGTASGAATPRLGDPVRMARVPTAPVARETARPVAPAPATERGMSSGTPVATPVTAPAAPAPQPASPMSAAPQPSAASAVASATMTATPTPTSAPASAAPAEAPVESTRTLADIMSEITIPDAERQRAVAPVNLAEVAVIQAAQRREREAAEARARKAAEAKEAARRKEEAEARAKADAEKKRLTDNPARYWVQIGAGNRSAMAFTLKRMKAKHDALGQYDGWSADWGRTARLVVGPFPSLAKARAVEADMKKAGSDAFVWHSAAGDEVVRVGGK